MDSKFYVYRKTAMLLREKGYDIKRDFLTPVYNENGCLYWSNHEDLSDKIPAITKAEAIDWLEGKNLTITIDWIRFNEQRRWCYGICNNETCDWEGSRYEYITRLEAEEAAIIEACEFLENGN